MRILKPSYRDRQGTLRKTSKWYIEFRDHNEATHRISAFTSKSASEELGRNIERLVSYHEATGGQADPSLQRWLAELPRSTCDTLVKIGLLDAERAGVNKPLMEHCTDFARALEAKGTTDKHSKLLIGRIERVIAACRFRYWSDVSTDRLLTHLSGLREDHLDKV